MCLEGLLHLAEEALGEGLHADAAGHDHLVVVELDDDDAVDDRLAVVGLVDMRLHAHEVGRGCLQVLDERRGQQRDERVHPLEGVEEGDEGGRAERERVHLGGNEEYAALLQQRGDHFEDVLHRETVQHRVVAETIGEGQTLLRRHRDLDHLLEHHQLRVGRGEGLR